MSDRPERSAFLFWDSIDERDHPARPFKKGVEIVREFAGTISGAVDGIPYAGDFEEHAHEHE